MLHRPSRTARAIVAAIPLGIAFLLPSLAHAATRAYPGPAPCDTTLQKCIDDAQSGDRIEIATATPIVEFLRIKKAITLTGAPNVVPTIGNPSATTGANSIDVQVNDATAAHVALRGLKLARTSVLVHASGSATGHRFTVTDCELTYGFIDVDVQTADSTVELLHNSVQSGPSDAIVGLPPPMPAAARSPSREIGLPRRCSRTA